jgi:hypothetical protein
MTDTIQQQRACGNRVPRNQMIISTLAVPGHALLWLIAVKWKRKKREEAHVSNMFNFTMLVGIVFFVVPFKNYK